MGFFDMLWSDKCYFFFNFRVCLILNIFVCETFLVTPSPLQFEF